MFMWYTIWCTEIHEFLQIIVEILKHQKQLSITVKYLKQTTSSELHI